MSVDEKKQRRRGRSTFLLLLAVFFVPLLLAIVLSKSDSWRPSKTKNYGELITPVRQLAEFNLHSLDGAAFQLKDVQGKWSVVYVGGGDCNDICKEVLYKIRQSRLAQSGNAQRVHYIYLLTDKAPSEALTTLLREHDKLRVVTGETAELNKLISNFTLDPAQPVSSAQRAYIIDPMGRVMMSYKADFAGKGMIKDLELLLKVL